MATDAYPTYETVAECFERAYEQLREDNGENAPNSYTWFAPTLEGLAEEVGDGDFDPTDSTPIGDPTAPTVAWVYECNGRGLYRICRGASDGAIIDLFGKCMGYDL